MFSEDTQDNMKVLLLFYSKDISNYTERSTSFPSRNAN